MEEKFDVIVGIPSYNESKTIGYVTQMAGKGLAKYFPSLRKAIVNCDNNSQDGTKEAFLSTVVPDKVAKKYISTPESVVGKGNNFLNLFRFCQKAEAKIIIVVDADLRSITPDWVKYLGAPIRKGYDFVAPLYSRHQFDGTITNHFCYPLAYALSGIDIRQPIGGDCAFSSRLCSYWLEQKWDDMVRQYGVDIFMSLNTFFGDFNICETGLGTKIHNVSSPKLGRMFEEVVYTLFSTLLKYKSKWLTPWSGKNGAPVCHPQNIRKISTYGLRKMVEPQTLEIDIMNLKKNCHSKYEMYHGPVRQYLSPYAYQQISDMVDMDHYDLDIMLWTQIVYSMIYMFDKGDEKTKIDIVNALKPLYFARSISFDYKTSRYSVPFAEREVISQAMAFLSQKPYLLGLYMGNGKGR